MLQDQGNVEYAIFDGSFLYHRANDLIQNYDATNETIAAHLKALLSAMLPYQPFLFYLSSKDVGKRLILAQKSRGQAPATEVQIAFEVERKKRQMQILELLPIQAHVFDISDCDWEPGGRLAVVEWKKENIEMGPPASHRNGSDETVRLITGEGLKKASDALKIDAYNLDFDLHAHPEKVFNSTSERVHFEGIVQYL